MSTSLDGPNCKHGWNVFLPTPCPKCVKEEPRIFRMHIFEAKGNRFAFTSKFSYFLEDEPSLTESDCIFFAMNFGEITYTGECLNVPSVDGEITFEHVKGEITSPLFFHGYATIYYLSGPIFDKIKLEENKE